MDFLLNILSHWESALAVLLVLGGLIFFHELGHFAVARLFRIGVAFVGRKKWFYLPIVVATVPQTIL